jgi:methyl-galactoside transport system ATP-binding protein
MIGEERASMSDSGYLLEMTDISKSFPGVKALDSVSLRVRPGTVHALMGENGAGKSTLMKCLFGIYSPDSGQIRLEGKKTVLADARHALKSGISMIHQELHPIPYMSVMENIWLGRYPLRNFGLFKLVNGKRMRDDTRALLSGLQMDIAPKTLVKDLSVSKIQSMEIAKAVSYGARIIIMDEPTSSLTENEVEHLFSIIRKLRSEGRSIIYISHKMEEILEIADEVTIMRDGKVVGSYPAAELTTDVIIKRMVGRDLTHRFPERKNVPGAAVMKVEGFTSSDKRSFKDISFELREGEILGIGGLVGAQRTELVEAIFGLRSVKSGSLEIRGKKVSIMNPIQAKAHKLAILMEDRRTMGIFPVLSVFDNAVIANIGRYVGKFLFIDRKRGAKDVSGVIDALRVKTPSQATRMESLSGGNQQKVIFGRWLLTEPDIFLLDEPTRGIDVGAKYEIYTIIADLAARGKSIVMISSEMPELLGMSDRIMVMCEGRATGIVDGRTATQESIMELATRFMT